MADQEDTQPEEEKQPENEPKPETSKGKSKRKKKDKNDDEEEEVEAESEDHDSDEERRLANLKKLGEYLNEMVYPVPSKEIETCCHTKRLGAKRPQVLASVYDDFHDVLSPRERAKRINEELEGFRSITTEQLESELRDFAAREEKKMKIAKNKAHKRAQLLKKCERACSEKILFKLVKRFASYVADRCENFEPPAVETESFQKMQQMLMCNLYLNLGDNKKISPDPNIAKMITVVIADLIMQIMFLAQNAHKYEEKQDICEPFLFEPQSSGNVCSIDKPKIDSKLFNCMKCFEDE